MILRFSGCCWLQDGLQRTKIEVKIHNREVIRWVRIFLVRCKTLHSISRSVGSASSFQILFLKRDRLSRCCLYGRRLEFDVGSSCSFDETRIFSSSQNDLVKRASRSFADCSGSGWGHSSFGDGIVPAGSRRIAEWNRAQHKC